MKVIEISFFGGFNICVDGRSLDMTASPRQLRLLSHLILIGDRSADKRELADLCFGYGEYAGRPEASLNALNALVHRLRETLSGLHPDLAGSIIYENGGYKVEFPSSVTTDVSTFESLSSRALGATDLSDAKKCAAEAIFLYKGEFLGGMLYDAYVRSLAEKYAAMHMRLVEFLFRILRSGGDHASICELAECAIAISPLCESFRYEKLLSLCEMQRYAEASEFYDTTVSLFAQKLSIAPSERFRSLGERIPNVKKGEMTVILSTRMSEKIPEIRRALSSITGLDEEGIDILLKR
jgi:DNA-binding SARP family transcriptional activator